MEHEATKMALTGATDDHAEAVQAFLDKRPPTFLGSLRPSAALRALAAAREDRGPPGSGATGRRTARR
jgi:hypothetical protein